ncbi:MAG TPA: hypothetical protein PKK61_13265 [Defluviitaleaceae bacterium]|nr:hypothetical protein [Defluviitaleaceae bacterium]
MNKELNNLASFRRIQNITGMIPYVRKELPKFFGQIPNIKELGHIATIEHQRDTINILVDSDFLL